MRYILLKKIIQSFIPCKIESCIRYSIRTKMFNQYRQDRKNTKVDIVPIYDGSVLPQFIVPTQDGSGLPQFIVPTYGSDLPQFVMPTYTYDLPQFIVPTQDGFDLPQFIVPTQDGSDLPQFIVLAYDGSDLPQFIVPTYDGPGLPQFITARRFKMFNSWPFNSHSQRLRPFKLQHGNDTSNE